MNYRYWLGTFARMAVSVLSAGAFFVAWLAAFLTAAKTDIYVVKAVGWLSAPIVTAAGFAAGMAALGLLTGSSNYKFLATFQWTLIGCTVGAVAVCWFGPMLIVFGMFIAGTASVFLREVFLARASEDQS